MKKTHIKIISIVLMIAIFMQVLSIANVSKAASVNKTTTYSNRPTADSISRTYKNQGYNVTSVTINSIKEEYKYNYQYTNREKYHDSTQDKEIRSNQTKKLKSAQTLASSIKSKGTYEGKVVKNAVIVSSDPYEFPVRVQFWSYRDKKINTSTNWTTAGFQSIATSKKNAKLLSKETHYVCTYTVYYSESSSKTSQEPTQKPDSDQNTQNNQPSTEQVIDNQNNEKQTETLDKGTSMNDAIAFVNQVFDIQEANKNNQAVIDLVNRTKTATDIVVAELTNLNAYGSLSNADFARQAYKRALGREATEDEIKNVEENNIIFSDVISNIVGSDEFKEVCKKYNLEVGTYSPVVFNKGVTQEKATNFLKHEFSEIMGRDPTGDEINAIVPKLVDGTINASVVVSSIFESSEFKNKALDDAQFVKLLVKAVTNQNIDEKTTNSYTERLSNGTTRNELIQELLRHSKFKALCDEYNLTVGSYSPRSIIPTSELASKFNTNVSKSILGENVDIIQTLSSYLTSGKYSAGDFVRLYVDSDNFNKRVQDENMSDADYVRALFKATVQREPTNEELTDYLKDIDDNNKSSILTRMLNLKEFASVCNKHYLPVKQYKATSSNGEKTETLESKAGGAVLEKVKITDTTGKTTEIVKSVKFDISKKTMGDVNGDGEVDSSDASLVLIYAAALGSNPDLFETQKEYSDYADINKDGVINASDAALILIYAAKYGATGNTDWNEIVNN